MENVYVQQLDFLEKKNRTMKLGEKRDVFMYTFLITGIVAANPMYSIAVLIGHQLGEDAYKLRDIGAKGESIIVNTMKDEITSNKHATRSDNHQ